MGLNKDITSTFFTRVLTVIIAFAKTVLIARFLGVEGNGEYAIFTASVGLFILILGFGIDSATVYYLSKREVDPQPLFLTFGLFSIVVSAIFFCVVHSIHMNISTSIFLPNSKISLEYELLLAGSLFFMLISKILQAILRSFKKFIQLNFILLINSIFTVSLFGGLYFTSYYGLKLDDIWIFYVYTFVQFNLVCLLVYYSKRYLSLSKFSFLTKAQVYSLLTFGGLAYFANIVQFLNYRLDYWFIEYYTDASQLGTYALAVSLIQMIWLLPGSVASVMFPYIANNDYINNTLNLIRISKLVFYILLVLFIVSIFCMAFLINLFFGEAFNETIYLFWILLFASIPLSYPIIFASYFAGIKRVDINFKSSLIGLIATVILDIILIPKFGNFGAAYATSSSYLATSFYSIYSMQRVTNISFRTYFLFNKIELQLFKSNVKKYTKTILG